MRAQRSLGRRVALGFGCSLGSGVAFGGLIGGGVALDVAHASGHVRERAVAVEVDSDAFGALDGCGKHSWRSDVRWRSLEPPAGYPPEFADDTCEPIEEGEEWKVVRSDSSLTPHVLIDPPRSYSSAWLQGAAAFGLGFLVCGLGLIGRAVWRRWNPASVPDHAGNDPVNLYDPQSFHAERVIDWLERHLTEAQVSEARGARAAGEPIRAIECVLDGLADNVVTVSGHDRSVLTTYGCASDLSPRGRAVLASLLGDSAADVASPEPTH